MTALFAARCCSYYSESCSYVISCDCHVIFASFIDASPSITRILHLLIGLTCLFSSLFVLSMCLLCFSCLYFLPICLVCRPPGSDCILCLSSSALLAPYSPNSHCHVPVSIALYFILFSNSSVYSLSLALALYHSTSC